MKKVIKLKESDIQHIVKRVISEEIDKGYYIIEDEDGPMLIHYKDLIRQEPELYKVIKILHTSDFDKAKNLYYKYLNLYI